ncbi:MAG: AMP-binding protein [Pseudomonas sp.]|jgi:acetyl-CoA synthetase|nr:AMP-binding protein [Pseudomonas sp.]MDY0415142.1 AMP-binding protein [Pseudomonas sp.]NLO54711.1 AMP-binding protein [Gammaproteobacteria bacterium]
MNLVKKDYFQASKEFDFEATVSNAISGSFAAMNACYECCDRHADGDALALIQENADGSTSRHSYAELRDQSAQFAHYLRQQGVQAGDVVAGLLPRGHALIVTILGTWRLGAIYQPLFTAFGPKAIEHRLQNSAAKLVVSDADNRSKLIDVAQCPPVMTVTDAQGAGLEPGDCDFWPALADLSTDFAPVMRSGDDPFLLMFTSGTTGLAKPLAVPLRAIVAFQRYMIDAVGLRAEDSFWNVADPGWAYGLYFGITGPMSMGLPVLSVAGLFNLDRCLEIAKKYKVNNLAGAPTVFRMLIAAGAKVADQWKGQLRVVSSAGEPLNPEVIRWFKEHLDVAINDHYGQTEMGMVLCNHHNLEHPMHMGAAGYASPGHRVVVLDENFNELHPGVPGILSVDTKQSPMFWFNGYKDMPTTAFQGRYYLSGDTAELNVDGSISFVGRSDDVITTSGYRVGPFDVESALLEHPAVIEAAVVGKPDAQRTEIIKAFVILQEGYEGTPELAEELRLHVRHRLAAHAYPREIEFPNDLPKTPSGKVQRFILRINEINKYNEEQDAKQAVC